MWRQQKQSVTDGERTDDKVISIQFASLASKKLGRHACFSCYVVCYQIYRNIGFRWLPVVKGTLPQF